MSRWLILFELIILSQGDVTIEGSRYDEPDYPAITYDDGWRFNGHWVRDPSGMLRFIIDETWQDE